MSIQSLQHDLGYALGRYFRLHKRRDEPAWARLLISSSIGLFFPTFFISLAVVFGRVNVGLSTLLFSYAMGLFIAFSIHGFYRAFELLVPELTLQRLNRGELKAGVFFAVVPIAIMLLCFWILIQLAQMLTQVEFRNTPFDSARAIGQFLFISLVFALIGTYLAWQAAKRRSLQLQATEAQLLRMQAQIEPHFLFNSLAAVQSLIDPAPERAKQMLEHFTDYLRASLQTLRAELCTLEQELQAVQSYLGLMQIRMDERLTFEIEASPEARRAPLLPLLLQPLVENAINHGLESKAEGGHLRISASVTDGLLTLQVRDNGLGLAAPKSRARPGNGLALKNIRERLAARYDDGAVLDLDLTDNGCCATLRLPLEKETPHS